jgi:hypothetical protein
MKKIAFACIMLLITLALNAQQNMADLFRVMPDSLMPMLTKNNRLDMIDFLGAKMKAEVINQLEGDSEMTFASADSISIQMNRVFRVDLFLVEAAQPYDSCRQVICVKSTYTLSTTAEEELAYRYFTVRWRPLQSPRLVVQPVPVSSVLKQDDEIYSKP